MSDEPMLISSLTNPRIKTVVKLRQRSHRDELNEMIVEGYRELTRALTNDHIPTQLFYCRELFQGENDDALLETASQKNCELFECSEPVFKKIAYRDRPDGLLGVAPQVRNKLEDIIPPDNALIVVAQAIEKPGNLGTILRSADAVGAHAVIVCDRCTDINNPNVVRASIGTIFSLPVVETSSAEVLKWLKDNNFKTVAATPHADDVYTDVDMTGNTAVIVGTEQYGLSDEWINESQISVRIPMLGQSDSLNVASATTILLYEAIRQRS